jgi:hypothetical protein
MNVSTRRIENPPDRSGPGRPGPEALPLERRGEMCCFVQGVAALGSLSLSLSPLPRMAHRAATPDGADARRRKAGGSAVSAHVALPRRMHAPRRRAYRRGCVPDYVSFYVSMYASMYLCIYVCIYVSTFLCVYVSMFQSFYVSMFLCFYVSMFLCFYVSMFLCFYVSNDCADDAEARPAQLPA